MEQGVRERGLVDFEERIKLLFAKHIKGQDNDLKTNLAE